MHRLVITALVVLFAVPSSAAAKPKKAFKPLKLQTEEQKSLYGVGLVVARQLEVFNLTPAELRIVQQGVRDGVRGRKPRVDFTTYSKKSVELGIARRDARGVKLEARAGAFIEKAAQEEGATKTKSGVVVLSLAEGKGASPVETDKVKLHYRGSLIDGKEVESSYKRGDPDEAPLNTFLVCLTEGVQLMKPGGKARMVCPPATAFGKESSGVIPPNATLVFEVELLEVTK